MSTFPKNYDARDWIDPIRAMMGDGFESDRDTLEHLGRHDNHAGLVFPEATNLTVTLTAHTNANVWSAWTELVDSGATTFSSKVTEHTHICAIAIESTSAADKIWMLEFSYGASKTVVARTRFVSQSIGMLELVQFFIIQSEHVPAGETVYYRLMSSSGAATCTIHIRYFLIL